MFNSIVEAIEVSAVRNPSKLCIVDESLQMTYSDYLRLIKKIAFNFKCMGISEGCKVVVEANQSVYYLAIELALHLLGAVFVPLEHNCDNAKLEYIAEKCDATLIVSNKVCSDRHNNLKYDDLLSILSEKDNLIEEYSLPSSETVSEILFSTGTTGKEKGIVLTHKSAVSVAENIVNAVNMQSDNIEMIPSPLNHSHGLRSYYANMLCGATVVIISNVIDMPSFFYNLEYYRVNSLDLVPAALSVILRLSKNKLGDYRDKLRFIEFGSAAMSDEDKEKVISLLPGVPLYNFYGSTESGRVTVYNFNTDNIKRGCIGKPTCNVDFKIVNESKKTIQSSSDCTGLLATAGSMNMLCYLDDEFETEMVLSDGFVYSNDEAYVDEDGDIILLGRKSDVLNVGGKKVSPEEIENVAKRFFGIEDCGCIGAISEVLGVEPKLYVQVKKGIALDIILFKKFLQENLESYKVPQKIEQIKKIPRTFNGKLLRKELQNLNNIDFK